MPGALRWSGVRHCALLHSLASVATGQFAVALLQLDLGRPTAAVDALLKISPSELVTTMVRYGHLLAPVPRPSPSSELSSSAATPPPCSLGQLLRVCAPAMLLHVLEQVGGQLRLTDGLRLIREPVDERFQAELRARPFVAAAPAVSAQSVTDGDVVQRYLERYARGPPRSGRWWGPPTHGRLRF